MEEVHSSTTHNPQEIMFYPHATSHQWITDAANSAAQFIKLAEGSQENIRTCELEEIHAKRVHELMHFRSHTVDTDGF